jgi:glycosyltransferase involved in cell wall biosynthesis
MVSYSFVDSDTRVLLYVHALAERGDQVDVICLGDPKDSGPMNGGYCYRVQDRVVNEKGQLSYFARIFKFLLKSSLRLTINHLKKPYDLIHVHSVPDFEVFSAIFPRLTGAKVILDMHDLVPELYASKFNGGGHKGLLVRALLMAEKMSIKFAHHVIIANHLWKEKIVARSVDEEKCSVILNYPNRSIFYRRPRRPREDTLVLMYPGTLNFHQGLDIAIRAFSRIHHLVPHAQFHLYGHGKEKDNLLKLILELHLTDKILVYDFLPTHEIVDRMANADIGVVPKRNDSFGGDAFSTKTFEFMALGVPVIVSGTRIDRYYFNDEVVQFFTPEDDKDLADAMLLLIMDKVRWEQLARNGLAFAEKYSWDKRRYDYLQLVDRLTGSSGIQGRSEESRSAKVAS